MTYAYPGPSPPCRRGKPFCHSGKPPCRSGKPHCRSGRPLCRSWRSLCRSGESLCRSGNPHVAEGSPSRAAGSPSEASGSPPGASGSPSVPGYASIRKADPPPPPFGYRETNRPMDGAAWRGKRTVRGPKAPISTTPTHVSITPFFLLPREPRPRHNSIFRKMAKFLD